MAACRLSETAIYCTSCWGKVVPPLLCPEAIFSQSQSRDCLERRPSVSSCTRNASVNACAGEQMSLPAFRCTQAKSSSNKVRYLVNPARHFVNCGLSQAITMPLPMDTNSKQLRRDHFHVSEFPQTSYTVNGVKVQHPLIDYVSKPPSFTNTQISHDLISVSHPNRTLRSCDLMAATPLNYTQISRDLIEAAPLPPNCHPQQKSLHQNAGSSKEELPSPAQLSVILLKLREELPVFFHGHHSYDMYASDLVFVSKLLPFTWTLYSRWGYWCFMSAFKMLVRAGHSWVNFDLLHISKDTDLGKIKARWRVRGRGHIRRREKVFMDGYSEFYVNADGNISRHHMDRMMPSGKEVNRVKEALGAPLSLLREEPLAQTDTS